MNRRLHHNEIPIDADLIRRLLGSQFPELSELPLVPPAYSGSTNRVFKLGEQLLIRLPRQPGGGESILKEYDWQWIGDHLDVETPRITHVGRPDFGYSEHWSIMTLIDGEHPDIHAGSTNDTALAEDLADVIKTLQSVPVPANAVRNSQLWSYRGDPLTEFDRVTRKNLELCRAIDGLDLDLDLAESVWNEAVALPEANQVQPSAWYHGDLVAENLLLTNDKLSAVLDIGINIGNPVVDLHGAWELFNKESRQVFRDRLKVSDGNWSVARAWALGIALGTFTYYWDTMPRRCTDRLKMANAALDERT